MLVYMALADFIDSSMLVNRKKKGREKGLMKEIVVGLNSM